MIGDPRSILGVRTSTLLRLLSSPLSSFDRNQPPLLSSPPPPPHEKGHKISPRGSYPTTQWWRGGGKVFPTSAEGGSEEANSGLLLQVVAPSLPLRDLISSSEQPPFLPSFLPSFLTSFLFLQVRRANEKLPVSRVWMDINLSKVSELWRLCSRKLFSPVPSS